MTICVMMRVESRIQGPSKQSLKQFKGEKGRKRGKGSKRGAGKQHSALCCCCVVMYLPFKAIVTVRVKQCTVRDTTTSDCSTTAPLALVHIRLSVATARACQDTVCVPMS